MSPIAQSGLTRMRSLGVVSSSKELSFFTPRLIAKHQAFEPLAIAIAEQKQVSFDYRKPDGELSKRSLSPAKLRYLSGQWVLLASEKGVLKNFLLRRIVSEVRALVEPAEPISAEEIAAAEQDLLELIESQVARLQLVPDSEAHWHFGAEGEQIEIHYMLSLIHI